MKPVSQELLAVFATRQFFVVDAITINLTNGGVLTYTTGDADIVVNSVTYRAGGQIGPYWDRSGNKAKCHWKVGVDVDQLIIDVIPGASQIQGVVFNIAVKAGILDGAELILDRVPMLTYGDTSRGFVRHFVGRVAQVGADRGVVTLTVNSHLELLDQQLPRNLYQAGCLNNLGDTACGVNLANYTASGTVSSGSTQAIVNASVIGAVTAYPGGNQTGAFDLGVIKFTGNVTAALAGVSATVKQCTFGGTNVISLVGFLPVAPVSGDWFTITYGCSKSCDLPLTVNGSMTAGQNNLDLINGSAGNSGMVGYTINGYGIPGGGYTVTSYASSAPGTPPVPTNGALYLSGNFTVSSPDQSHVYTLTKPGTLLNGCAKFGNLARFRGMPFVPVPSIAAG